MFSVQKCLKSCNKRGKCKKTPWTVPKRLFNDRTDSIVITLFLIVLPLLDHFVSFIGVGTAVIFRQGLIMKSRLALNSQPSCLSLPNASKNVL